MGLRFQRRLTLFPGVRLNFSRSGISASIGPRGASFTVGPRGSSLNLGIPGTGLSLRHSLNGGNGHAGQPELPSPRGAPVLPIPEPEGTQIASAPISEVNSEGLAALKKLLLEVIAERKSLEASIPEARQALQIAERRLRRAQHWFFGLFLKGKVPDRHAAVEAKRAELTGQEDRLSGAFIDADFNLDDDAKAAFVKLTEAFEQAATCARIWDVVSEAYEDTRVTRSAAARSLKRTPLSFSVAEDELLQTGARTLRLKNANGADLVVYPGFLMMADSREMALIDLRDVKLDYRQVRFVETDPVPSDAVVVDQTWAKVNKDGSPDKRFKGNYRIPIAGYGGVTIRTDNGVNEEYQFSSAEKAQKFAEAFIDYQTKLRMLGDKASFDTKRELPASASEPPAPSEPVRTTGFSRKAGALLQVAQAASLAHLGKVMEEFQGLLVADVKSFDGSHSMQDIERFMNYVAALPGQLQMFLDRVPETRVPKMGQVTATFVKSVRDLAHQSSDVADRSFERPSEAAAVGIAG